MVLALLEGTAAQSLVGSIARAFRRVENQGVGKIAFNLNFPFRNFLYQLYFSLRTNLPHWSLEDNLAIGLLLLIQALLLEREQHVVSK